MDVKERAEKISSKIVGWRRDLHQIPETGLKCPKTAEYICCQLREMGIPYQTYEEHSGITAIGKKEGKVIALRADMDGLNIAEQNNFSYASKNGKMHACGHDAHVAILLGAAKLLKEEEKNLNGIVKLIFQPDEEGLTGAKAMIKDGVLENPKVDCMYTLHVGSIIGHGTQIGDLLYKTGPVFASSDGFRIVICGKGGHASGPDQVNNPILAAAAFIEATQGLVARTAQSDVPTVLAITGINGGNGAVNIVPDTVEIVGGFRTLDSEVREKIIAEMERTLKNCAEIYHCNASMKLILGCPPTVNDRKTTEEFINSARKIISSDRIIQLEKATMGGEDASYYFQKVPGCYTFLYNSCPSDDGQEYPHHNGRFNINDSVLYLGSAVFVQAVLDQLRE